MTSLWMAAQAAVETQTLPEDAPAQTAELAAQAADGAVAAGGNLDMWQLVLHASIPVQLVMLLLLFASVASWLIIFRKKRVLDRAEREAERFEERFWSGAELSKLYSGATERGRVVKGPATRRLPILPLALGENGELVVAGEFTSKPGFKI